MNIIDQGSHCLCSLVFFLLQEIINAGLVPLIIQTLETVSVFSQVDKISANIYFDNQVQNYAYKNVLGA